MRPTQHRLLYDYSIPCNQPSLCLSLSASFMAALSFGVCFGASCLFSGLVWSGYLLCRFDESVPIGDGCDGARQLRALVLSFNSTAVVPKSAAPCGLRQFAPAVDVSSELFLGLSSY